MAPYQTYPNNYGNRGTLSLSNKQRFAQNASNSAGKGDKEASRPLPEFNLSNLTKELFDSTADKCAETISQSASTVNQSTQIRRFYDELAMWNERADSDDKFEEILPFVYMIKSKVAYAKGRGTVDATFQNFISKTICQINDRKTLKHAKLFMEAVMGFYKQYRTK